MMDELLLTLYGGGYLGFKLAHVPLRAPRGIIKRSGTHLFSDHGLSANRCLHFSYVCQCIVPLNSRAIWLLPMVNIIFIYKMAVHHFSSLRLLIKKAE
jgi:hypothetical protein